MKPFHILSLGAIMALSIGSSAGQGNTCATGDATANSIKYVVDGKKVSSLENHVNPGSTVTVTYSVPAGSPQITFSLVSYVAPTATFSYDNADQQVVYKSATKTGGPGTYTLSVTVPKCYFQIDFVKGCIIEKLGPASSNNFYGRQNRLIDHANGGTHACSNTTCGGHGNADTCKKVTICHVPPGNPSNAHEITISKHAVAAHFRNHPGDHYGQCKKDTTPPPACDTCCVCDYDGDHKNDRIYGSVEYSTDQSIKVYFSPASDSAVITSSTKMQTVVVTYADFTTQTYDKIDANTYVVSSQNPIVAVTVDGNYIENFAFTDPNFMCDCIPNPSPFPVTMTSFDAKVIAPNTVKLQWMTASETNNNYFQIEKSSDITNWEDVPSCKVPGSGTTQKPHVYSCVDMNANSEGQNIVYYRNKQVDYDGAYEYSNTIHIRLENAAYPTAVQNAYPNPVEDQIHIQYNSDDNGIFNIRVLSLDGKTLLTNQYTAKRGNQVIDLELPESKLKSGFYILEVQNDEHMYRQKIYKQ